MAETDTPPPLVTPAEGEDVLMEEGEVAKPDGIVGANGAGDLGGWKSIHFGLVGHDGQCAICSAMRDHLKEAMASGIAGDIVRAVQEMIDESHARLQFPVMSIDHWADSLAPVINCPSETLPITPVSWLTYLANTLTAEIASAEVVWRERNRPPGVRQEEVALEERQQRSRVRLLRDVLEVISKLQSMTVTRLFAPISDDTPHAILNELPRRMRGVGESRRPRRPVFPEYRVVQTYLGDIVCAVPSRVLSPFELIDGEHSLILPRGAGGHAHIPGSLWNFVPRVACSEEELRNCTWPMIYESPKDHLRLFIEALVIPWLWRSLLQRSWVFFFLHMIIKEKGEEAAAAICNAVGVVDLDEQTEFWARTKSEVPLFVNRWVVGNNWRWDELGLTVWQFMSRAFPHGPARAMSSFRYARDYSAAYRAPRPPFRPVVMHAQPRLGVYLYQDVHDHLINVCGIELSDLKHFIEVSRGWDNLDREAHCIQEHFRWQELVRSGSTSTIGVQAIIFEHDDPPISSISAVQLLASLDRRRDTIRRAPTNAPTQPRNTQPQQPSSQARNAPSQHADSQPRNASSAGSSQPSSSPSSSQATTNVGGAQQHSSPPPSSPAPPQPEMPWKKRRLE